MVGCTGKERSSALPRFLPDVGAIEAMCARGNEVIGHGMNDVDALDYGGRGRQVVVLG